MLPPDPRLPLAEDPYRNPSTHIVESALIAVVVSAIKTRLFFNWLIDKVVIDRRVIYRLMAAALLLAVLMWEEPVSEWIDAIHPHRRRPYLRHLLPLLRTHGRPVRVHGRQVDHRHARGRCRGSRTHVRTRVTRSLCRLIPFDAVSLFLSEDDVRRAWHDSITAT